MSETNKRKEPKRKFALWVKESSLIYVRGFRTIIQDSVANRNAHRDRLYFKKSYL